jgi:hypothetical protein
MDTTKQAGLWDGIKRLWRKWRGKGDYQGPTPTEDQVVDSFAEDFLTKKVWPQGNQFIKQVVLEANKAGLPHDYLPYVFWMLVEGRKHWPQMDPESAKALRLARDLAMSQGLMPNYRPAMRMPPPELEATVDRVLRGLGFWVLKDMGSALLRDYAASLQKWQGLMAKVVGDTLPAEKAAIYLKMLFETYLKRRPGHFLDGMLLERVVFGLLR